MATHYSANQYENAFAANRLQNYQIPNRYKEHPTPRDGSTCIISNDRGHLLPGVPRSKESPWGNFKGTWDDHMDFMNTKKHTIKNTLKPEEVRASESHLEKDREEVTSKQKQRDRVVTPEAKQICESEKIID